MSDEPSPRRSGRLSSIASNPSTPSRERGGGTPNSQSTTTPRRSAQKRNAPSEPQSPPLAPLPAVDDDEDFEPLGLEPSPSPQPMAKNVLDDSSPVKFPMSPGAPSRLSQRGDIVAQGTDLNRSLGGVSTATNPGVARLRPDLNPQAQHHRTFRSQVLGADKPKLFVWGTTICVEEVQKTFEHFIREYKHKPDEDELGLTRMTDSTDPKSGTMTYELNEHSPFYMQRLAEIVVTEEPHLSVNLAHMLDEKENGKYENLYRKIICYPADVIPYLDMRVNEIYLTEHEKELPYQIEIRPFNGKKTRNMRGLNPEDMDQLITVTGMVTRTSALIPEMRSGFFECSVCHSTREVEVDRSRIEEPVVCRMCNTNHSFQLIHNRSIFMDKQIVKLQESPDDMPAGQTPHTVTVFAHGNLVDTVQPGDRVTVTGIFRAMPLRSNPRMRTVKAVYKTHVDVLHFRKSDKLRLHQVDDGATLSAATIDLIKKNGAKPDIYERLSKAIAPSIFEHGDIKKGILCLLFGGARKDLSKQGRGHFRAELNVLLCGDPGTSKSQLLQYVYKLLPRGQYTSGKGSSAVGLTASVTRDPDTKHFVLQTGALVLSDNGVCCIDEFDKMNESTRAVLHEVMEQQTLSIAKAGIICQLNARASVLAAANPVDSKWNRHKTIVENVQLPHTLLSRFDLIFLLVDPQDELYDRRLATHLVSLYHQDSDAKHIDEELLDVAFIRDYISYAKTIEPIISDDASARLIERYIEMRKIGSGRGQVSAYPRQLESLIRLSEARARIRLAHTVTVDDVEEAYRLHREALKQSSIDPLTGRVDVNILAGGVSATTRKNMNELALVLKEYMMKQRIRNFNFKSLLQEMKRNSDTDITTEVYEGAVKELIQNDDVARNGDKLSFLRQSAGSH